MLVKLNTNIEKYPNFFKVQKYVIAKYYNSSRKSLYEKRKHLFAEDITEFSAPGHSWLVIPHFL